VQILDNLCTCGYIDISSDIRTLVVDECELCAKNHPYNLFFKKHIHTLDTDSRPQVLGLAYKMPTIGEDIWKENLTCTVIAQKDQNAKPEVETSFITKQAPKNDIPKPFMLYSNPQIFLKRATMSNGGIYLHTITTTLNGETTTSLLGFVTEKPLDYVSNQPISLHDETGQQVIMKVQQQVRIRSITEEQYRQLQLFHSLLLSIMMNEKEFLNPVDHFGTFIKFYLIVPVKDQQIDWHSVYNMQALTEHFTYQQSSTSTGSALLNVMDITQVDSLENLIAVPRYGGDPHTNGIFERSIYTIAKIRDDLSSISPFSSPKFATYFDYFKTKYDLEAQSTGPLLEVNLLTHAHNGMNKNISKGKKNAISPILLPEFLAFYPLADVFRSAIMIPSFMWGFEMSLLVRELEMTLTSNIPEIEPSESLYALLFTALSAKSANLQESYDLLEFLGDDIVKLLCCISLYFDPNDHDEGKMTTLKSELVANKYLCKLGQSKELEHYILCENTTQFSYCPPLFSGPVHTTKLYTKNVANVVEALIGAILKHSGLRGAFKFLQWLEPSFQLGLIENMIKKEDDKPWIPFEDPEVIYEQYNVLDHYTFKNPLLLETALSGSGKQFERLEFVGDAVLDYIITCRFMLGNTSEKTEGLLSLARSIAASNLTYSALSVISGLHTRLGSNINPNVTIKIERFIDANAMMLAEPDWDPENLQDEGPKLLGDLFETVAGAIFIDSGMDIRTVHRVYEPIWRDLLVNKIKLEKIKKHPINRVTIFFQAKGCNDYKFVRKSDDTKVFELVVHGEVMCAGRGGNKKGAKKNTAVEALIVIESGEKWKQLCTCKS
jgi:dsRNA-specific ribonuclease